jgi:hypothetical protein
MKGVQHLGIGLPGAADAILFLASAESDFITGLVLQVTAAVIANDNSREILLYTHCRNRYNLAQASISTLVKLERFSGGSMMNARNADHFGPFTLCSVEPDHFPNWRK